MDEATWRENLWDGDDRLELQSPADPARIAALEFRLGVTLPAELRGLYQATNGIYDTLGEWYVMWQLQDLASRNLEAWNGWESEARRRFLGFGDDGTGNPFCVALDGGSTVFTWSPIDQEARPLASDLREFWFGWLLGEMKT